MNLLVKAIEINRFRQNKEIRGVCFKQSNKTKPKKKLVKINNPPDKEYRVMIIRWSTNLEE